MLFKSEIENVPPPLFFRNVNHSFYHGAVLPRASTLTNIPHGGVHIPQLKQGSIYNCKHQYFVNEEMTVSLTDVITYETITHFPLYALHKEQSKLVLLLTRTFLFVMTDVSTLACLR